MDADEWPASRSDLIIPSEISHNTHQTYRRLCRAPEMFGILSRADYVTKAYINIFISEENYNTAGGNIFLLFPRCQHGLFFGGEGRGGRGRMIEQKCCAVQESKGNFGLHKMRKMS